MQILLHRILIGSTKLLSFTITVGVFLFAAQGFSQDHCEKFFKKRDAIYYGIFDATMSVRNPGWNVFFMGEGATAKVMRFQSRADPSSNFVRKLLKGNSSVADQMSGLRVLDQYLSNIPGIRVLKMHSLSRDHIDFEWVPGRTLLELLKAGDSRAKALEDKYLKISRILEARIQSIPRALRVPTDKNDSTLDWAYIVPPDYAIVALKRDNILVDGNTEDFVVIDSY